MERREYGSLLCSIVRSLQNFSFHRLHFTTGREEVFLCYIFFLFGSIVLISLKYEHVYAFAIVYARTDIKHLGMFYLWRYMEGGAIGNAWHASQVTYTRDKEGRQENQKAEAAESKKSKKIGWG